MHIVFHLETPRTIPTQLSAGAIEAAKDFVDMCCQHVVYISGKGDIPDVILQLQTGSVGLSSADKVNSLWYIILYSQMEYKPTSLILVTHLRWSTEHLSRGTPLWNRTDLSLSQRIQAFEVEVFMEPNCIQILLYAISLSTGISYQDGQETWLIAGPTGQDQGGDGSGSQVSVKVYTYYRHTTVHALHVSAVRKKCIAINGCELIKQGSNVTTFICCYLPLLCRERVLVMMLWQKSLWYVYIMHVNLQHFQCAWCLSYYVVLFSALQLAK